MQIHEVGTLCWSSALRPNCDCASQINPDGHCLFSAIADQLALLNILPANEANYATVRAAASTYLSQHPDDFLPFLPSISGEDGVGATDNNGLMDAQQFEQYCSTIRDTSAWGGEPEILALSRAYNVPIQVIQAGTPSVVTHTPDGNLRDNLPRDAKIVRISFHRRMYGLGEVRVVKISTSRLQSVVLALQFTTTEEPPYSCYRQNSLNAQLTPRLHMFPLRQARNKFDQPKKRLSLALMPMDMATDNAYVTPPFSFLHPTCVLHTTRTSKGLLHCLEQTSIQTFSINQEVSVALPVEQSSLNQKIIQIIVTPLTPGHRSGLICQVPSKCTIQVCIRIRDSIATDIVVVAIPVYISLCIFILTAILGTLRCG